MEPVILVVGFVASLLMLTTTTRTYHLARLVHVPGIGRINFWSLFSLKVWCISAIWYGILNRLGWLARADGLRTLFPVLLGLYLIVQPIVVHVAITRWEAPEVFTRGFWLRKYRQGHDTHSPD